MIKPLGFIGPAPFQPGRGEVAHPFAPNRQRVRIHLQNAGRELIPCDGKVILNPLFSSTGNIGPSSNKDNADLTTSNIQRFVMIFSEPIVSPFLWFVNYSMNWSAGFIIAPTSLTSTIRLKVYPITALNGLTFATITWVNQGTLTLGAPLTGQGVGIVLKTTYGAFSSVDGINLFTLRDVGVGVCDITPGTTMFGLIFHIIVDVDHPAYILGFNLCTAIFLQLDNIFGPAIPSLTLRGYVMPIQS